MGILGNIASALGLQRPLEAREPRPFAFSPSARTRLARLDPGTGVFVSTSPAANGRLVRVWEGPGEGVNVEDESLLRGLVLDWDERWLVRPDLAVRGAETPNPESRLYVTTRLLAETVHYGPGPGLAARVLAVPGVRSALFRKHTVTVGREPGWTWSVLDRGVEAALKEHFLACGGPLTTADRPPVDDDLEAEVRRVLEERVLPAVHADGGDIELLGVDDGVVRVRMVGACRGCPASQITLKLGVERALRDALPQIVSVEAE